MIPFPKMRHHHSRSYPVQLRHN